MLHTTNEPSIHTKPVPRRPLLCALLALLSPWLLAGCSAGNGDTSAQAGSADDRAATARIADSAQVDPALEDAPCELASTDMLASAFNVPAAQIEYSPAMSWCDYTWEGDGKKLAVKVKVNGVFDDAQSAASRFRAVTAGISGAELDLAMTDIKKKAASQAADNSKAVNAIVGDTNGSPGIQFEDVAGVGDEARFALTVGAGDLHVRVGNLNFTVSAYSGPSMPAHHEIRGLERIAARKAWRQETMPQRKQAAIKLSRAIIETL